MKKVKIFTSYDDTDLEDDINDFLGTELFELIDIKYSTTPISSDYDRAPVLYSAMVIYKEVFNNGY